MTVKSNTRQFKAKLKAAVVRGVANGVEIVLDEASSMVMDGQKSGRIYRRRGAEHQASAPGEAPASDTGRLVQSGHTEVLTEGQIVRGRVTWWVRKKLDLGQSSDRRLRQRRARWSVP